VHQGLFEEIAVASTKPAKSAESTVLPFVVRTIEPGVESGALECPACQSPLNLIQPDENDPTRLIGTCESCSAWGVLVELEPDWQKALLIEVPGGDQVCENHEQAVIAAAKRRGE
jgi:hypothetical protein